MLHQFVQGICIGVVIILGVNSTAVQCIASDWPMWRSDAGRTAASTANLPERLYPAWSRVEAARKPVWDDPLAGPAPTARGANPTARGANGANPFVQFASCYYSNQQTARPPGRRNGRARAHANATRAGLAVVQIPRERYAPSLHTQPEER